MAVRRKIFIPNSIYFITFTIYGWRNVFVNDESCGLVYKWFDYMRDNYENKIYGYVIMPNHVHLLLKVTNRSKKLPVLIQNAKRFLAYQIVSNLKKDNKQSLLSFFREGARVKYGARHKIFQDRYDSLLIDTPKFFLEKLNYIHKNPCVKKWNLANNLEDYRYSSASNYILGKGYYSIDIMEF